MDRDLERFCENFEAYAELSRKQYARRKPISVRDYYYTAMESYSHYDTEPYIELTIPQHRLRELIENNLIFDRLKSEFDYASRALKEQADDAKIRAHNPSVQKAYDRYRVLLEMSRT